MRNCSCSFLLATYYKASALPLWWALPVPAATRVASTSLRLSNVVPPWASRVPILPLLTSVWTWWGLTEWWLFLLILVTASAVEIQLLFICVPLPSCRIQIFCSSDAIIVLVPFLFPGSPLGALPIRRVTESAHTDHEDKEQGHKLLHTALLTFSFLVLFNSWEWGKRDGGHTSERANKTIQKSRSHVLQRGEREKVWVAALPEIDVLWVLFHTRNMAGKVWLICISKRLFEYILFFREMQYLSNLRNATVNYFCEFGDLVCEGMNPRGYCHGSFLQGRRKPISWLSA